jgi:hypothetical protein
VHYTLVDHYYGHLQQTDRLANTTMSFSSGHNTQMTVCIACFNALLACSSLQQAQHISLVTTQATQVYGYT